MKVDIKKSTNSEKKLMAVFYDGDKKIKTVHFGSAGMSDYTKHKDDERKKRYIARHSNGKEDWNNYMTAGALSRWILWSKPTLTASIKDYKNRFNLKQI